MGAEAARVLDYDSRYYYGSAPAREQFPARELFPEREQRPLENPHAQERVRQRERTRTSTAAKDLPGISMFSVVGTLFVTLLMTLVVLAQISYNEAAADSVRLGAQLRALEEQQKILLVEFESVMDMKEVERYARDVLGMSKPDTHQLAVVHSTASDRAEVLNSPEGNSLRDFGSFISSLLEYFKR